MSVNTNKPQVDPAVAQRWAAAMLEVFVPEQVEQVIKLLQQTYDTAVVSECDQTFTILLSKRGYPLRFEGSNAVKPFDPTRIK